MKLLVVTQVVDMNHPILGFFWSWLNRFSHTFEKVTVICLEKGSSADSISGNIEVLSLGKEDGVSRAEYLKRFWKYIWEKRGQYDCVFVHMNTEYVLLGGLLWRWWGKKIILWYMHGTVTAKLRIAVWLSNVTLTATRKSCRVKSKKVHVVGHGIDIEYFLPRPRATSEILRLITVGRISPVKDYETVIRALGRLKQTDFKFVYTIVGAPATANDRTYAERLAALIEECKLTVGGDIVFAGPVRHSEVKDHLYRADLFIHTSRTGSLDKVALEAMATALPVLSSNEASQEVFDEHTDELYFSEGADEELAKKILIFSKKNEKDRYLLGFKLQNIVLKNHSLPHLVNEIQKTCAA